jgi:hypothetical protein
MPGSLTPPRLTALAYRVARYWLLRNQRHRPYGIMCCRGSIASRFRIPAYEVRYIRFVLPVTRLGHAMFATAWIAPPLHAGLSPASFGGPPRAH